MERILDKIEADDCTRRYYSTFADNIIVNPTELEKMPGRISTERRRWGSEGRIPIIGTSRFHKGGREMEHPVYDR